MRGSTLRVEELCKTYPGPHRTAALQSATLDLPPQSCTALVGRTGSGKSTLALCLAGLVEPTGGRIWKDGVLGWPGKWRPRRDIQLVRQDSPLALNPRWAVRDLIAEPFRLQPNPAPRRRMEDIQELAASVGIDPDCLDRRPGQLSGGQRQRVAIARALAVPELDLLILDEPLRGLDPPSVDALVALLLAMQRRNAFSLLYITHDLDRVRAIAGRIAVMAAGTIVETSPCEEFFTQPRHPAGRMLVEAQL